MRVLASTVAGVALAIGTATIALPHGTSYASSCPTANAAGCPALPSLTVDLGGRIVPERPPSHKPVPVGVELWVKVETTDGTHPSALREATIDLDRGIGVDAGGLPVCRPFVRHRVGDLKKRCRSAIVGTGSADFEIAVPEGTPIRRPNRLSVYNGGDATVYVVAFANPPLPRVTVVPVEAARMGRRGLHTVARIPRVAGGKGSLLDFNLRIKRLFTFKGQRKSYATASCPNDQIATAASLIFRNEAHVSGVPAETVTKGRVAIPCTSR